MSIIFKRILFGMVLLLAVFFLIYAKKIRALGTMLAGSEIGAEMSRVTNRTIMIDELVEVDLDGDGSKERVHILSSQFIKYKGYKTIADFGHHIGSVNVTVYNKNNKPLSELYFEEKPKSLFLGVNSVKVADLNNDHKEEVILMSTNYVMVVYYDGNVWMTRPLKCGQARVEYNDRNRLYEIISKDGAKYRWSQPKLLEDGFERIN